jgi:hypothetical protein
LFRLSTELKYLDLRRYEDAVRYVDEIGLLIGGRLKTGKRQGPAMTSRSPAPVLTK